MTRFAALHIHFTHSLKWSGSFVLGPLFFFLYFPPAPARQTGRDTPTRFR